MDLRGPREQSSDEPELALEPAPPVPAPAPVAAMPTWPVLVLALSVLVAIGYQTFNLVREHQQLRSTRTAQTAPYEQARRLRTQLEGIARRTRELADKGNPGAGVIVEQLARRGVRLQQGPPPVPGAAAPAPSR